MENQTPEINEQVPVEEVPSQAVSLDALDEFEFQGAKLTPDYLHQVLTEYNDLKSGRDSYASAAHFYANLPHDLEIVAANPAKAQEFKKMYPEEFHGYVDILLKSKGQVAEKTQSKEQTNSQTNEVIEELKKELMYLKHQVQKSTSNEYVATLNQTIDPIFEKYPLAIEESVLLEAEAMLSKGMKLTPHTWERLIKSSHEQIAKKSSDYYKNEYKQKKQASMKGKESGLGGSAMGNEPPKKPRTFDEAQEAMIAHYSKR